MQRPSEAKRQAVLQAAARLFARRPFHEVRLDDVAAAARVGKGTVYIYFKNKEDLYVSLIREGFRGLVERLNAQIETEGANNSWDTLSLIVHELVAWATQHPQLFHIMRVAQPQGPDKELGSIRKQFGSLIEAVIRKGIRTGDMCDPHPELTAQFVPACVRASLLHGPEGVSPDIVAKQVMRVLSKGIGKGSK